MKTLEEFRRFCDTQLAPELRRLENKRKAVIRNIGAAALVILTPLLIISAAMLPRSGPPAFFLVIIGIIILAGATYFLSRSYVLEFKPAIIGRIVKFACPDLKYRPADFIPQSLFEASNIFTTQPNRYKGDDRVSGKVGDTAIDFSEIKAQRESGSGKDKRTYTIFHGLFFVAEFNKHFVGQTLVLPDTAQMLFGHVGQMMQSWNITRGNLIKLEDPEFERLFVVYGTDQVGARYILSTSLMARIVEFRKKTDKDIYISFLYSKIAIAIPYDRQLFEPKLFTTLLDYDVICEYFNDLQLAIGIVEDLNLNTRIWSKQVEA
jgi:hypothetical protein